MATTNSHNTVHPPSTGRATGERPSFRAPEPHDTAVPSSQARGRFSRFRNDRGTGACIGVSGVPIVSSALSTTSLPLASNPPPMTTGTVDDDPPATTDASLPAEIVDAEVAGATGAATDAAAAAATASGDTDPAVAGVWGAEVDEAPHGSAVVAVTATADGGADAPAPNDSAVAHAAPNTASLPLLACSAVHRRA